MPTVIKLWRKTKMRDLRSDLPYPCSNCAKVADPKSCSNIKNCPEYFEWFESAWNYLLKKFGKGKYVE